MKEIKIGTQLKCSAGEYFTICEVVNETGMKCIDSNRKSWEIGRIYWTPSDIGSIWEIIPSKSENFSSLYEKLNEI